MSFAKQDSVRAVVELGSDTSPAAAGTQEWVTKTNVLEYAACARASWLIRRGAVSHEDTIPPWRRELLAAGVAFESSLVANADPIDPDRVIAAAPHEHVRDHPLLVLQTGAWANEDLSLRGVPDGIEIESGAWAPVEVKRHARPTSRDRLELAFYWLLLAPQRRTMHDRPHGYLLLDTSEPPACDAGQPGIENEPVRVDLRRSHLDNARAYIEAVRRTWRGPEPGSCGRCHICTEVRPPTRAQLAAHRGEDLLEIAELNYNRAQQLAVVGISQRSDLLRLGVDEVLDRIRGNGWGIGRTHVTGWVAHAQAWAENRPVIFGDPPPMPTAYIAVDLEYECPGRLWLAGMRTANGELTQLWAWDDAEEHDLMQHFVAYCHDHPRKVLITYNGGAADLPALGRASFRTGVRFYLQSPWHFDLYRWVQRHLRLPVPSLALKDVAQYFRVPRREGTVGSGEESVWAYRAAAVSRSTPIRTAERARLEAYNADDVDALVAVIERLRGLYPQSAWSPPRYRIEIATLTADEMTELDELDDDELDDDEQHG